MIGGFTRQGTQFYCLPLSAARLPSVGTPNPVKRRFLSAAAEAIIPALLLAALIILHPVSIDLAVERFFAPDGTFPLQNSAALLFFHKWAKLLTVFVALGVIAIAVKDRAKISPRISVTEAGYLITAILVCVGTVSVLKDMTGVYCPVSTTFFGSTHPILAPHFGFRRLRRNRFQSDPLLVCFQTPPSDPCPRRSLFRYPLRNGLRCHSDDAGIPLPEPQCGDVPS